MTKLNLITLLLCACCCLLACERERDPCLQPVIMNVRVGAYQHPDSLAVRDTLLPKALLNPIDAQPLYNRGLKGTSKLLLTLAPQADSCRWYIQADSGKSALDTLSFYYRRRLQFLSNACGYAYFYEISRVEATRHALDSVVLTNGNITNNANVEHLKIYY